MSEAVFEIKRLLGLPSNVMELLMKIIPHKPCQRCFMDTQSFRQLVMEFTKMKIAGRTMADIGPNSNLVVHSPFGSIEIIPSHDLKEGTWYFV